MDEGYIKFQAIWQKEPEYPKALFQDLIKWRQACYAEKWIGVYPEGIGFGNISCRIKNTDQFFISGSGTGQLPVLSAKDIAKVTAVDAPNNKLWCSGPILASSESMSHAVIYRLQPWVNGVIHIHDLLLWQKLLHKVPTTAATAPYGSPEMVASINDLIKETHLPQSKIFVMEGHPEGIFAFGSDLEEAFHVLCAGGLGTRKLADQRLETRD